MMAEYRYRVTGLAGDSQGRAKRTTIATVNSRSEAVETARKARKNFAKVQIEPISKSRDRGSLERMEDESAAKKAQSRRRHNLRRKTR